MPDFSLLTSISEEPPVQVKQKVWVAPSNTKERDTTRRPLQKISTESLEAVLQNKSETEIRTLLGAPNRTLREGQLLVWQYVTDVCQWDMYFQEDSPQKNNPLHGVIIHHQGRILTAKDERTQCEESLRQTKA